MATKEELTMNLPEWWAGQPMQKFEVVDSTNQILTIEAHEAQVGTPQPTLSFVRYVIRQVDVVRATGGKQNRVEEEDVIDHPLMIYSAVFSPGAWISCRDLEVSGVAQKGGPPRIIE
jgi:hypothetical protein